MCIEQPAANKVLILGRGVTPGIPFKIIFPLFWGILDQSNWGTQVPLPLKEGGDLRKNPQAEGDFDVYLMENAVGTPREGSEM